MRNPPVYSIDPIRDQRWTTFIENDPRASVFHAPEWLDALRRTYRYEPVGLTTAAPGQDLNNGIVLCRVKSWLTGSRMVSLPFSDHCQPLVNGREELQHLMRGLERETDAGTWAYIEIRPVGFPESHRTSLEPAETFWFHRLDLSRRTENIFQSFHKDCVQRKIRRAEREALSYEVGCSELLLQQFYQLLVLTRRRQRMPPQPIAWFRNLIACMGDAVKIRVASRDGRAVASILTLRHKKTMTYKYGGSDKRFANLGGMQLLLWKSIEEAKSVGLSEFDMGRSDLNNDGLITFKDRWGAGRSELVYLQYRRVRPSRPTALLARIARQVASLAPNALVGTAGKALYRHLACAILCAGQLV
jgi:hypothetical protein